VNEAMKVKALADLIGMPVERIESLNGARKAQKTAQKSRIATWQQTYKAPRVARNPNPGDVIAVLLGL
jgi:hypothetical protein